MSNKKTKNHHHGNLRTALIDAGIELLDSGGLDALTLRKCAARAGVSHAAPAHHFDGLVGLKSAIAQEGFRRFSASMRTAIDQGPQTPHGRLKSICRGYLHFGLQNRALLQLIFGVPAERAKDFDIGDEDSGAYQILRETCAPFASREVPAEVIEVQVWSLIHGYTLLFLSGRFGVVSPDMIEDGPFDQVVALLDHIGVAPQT